MTSPVVELSNSTKLLLAEFNRLLVIVRNRMLKGGREVDILKHITKGIRDRYGGPRNNWEQLPTNSSATPPSPRSSCAWFSDSPSPVVHQISRASFCMTDRLNSPTNPFFFLKFILHFCLSFLNFIKLTLYLLY